MLAIIPARGGSKGVPGKNIKPIAGKPLINYTIDAALKSKSVSQVVLSTDSEEIARIGKAAGAEVPFMRPDYLAGDQAKAIDAYTHCIDFMSNKQGKSVEEVIVLLPTTPLRRPDDIDNAILLFNQKKADSVISYTPEDHPINWHRYVDEESRVSPVFDNSIENRQQHKSTFYPNGSIYVFKSEILKRGIYFTDQTFAYIMPRKYSVDIDDELDVLWAEFLLTKLSNEDSIYSH